MLLKRIPCWEFVTKVRLILFCISPFSPTLILAFIPKDYISEFISDPGVQKINVKAPVGTQHTWIWISTHPLVQSLLLSKCCLSAQGLWLSPMRTMTQALLGSPVDQSLIDSKGFPYNTLQMGVIAHFLICHAFITSPKCGPGLKKKYVLGDLNKWSLFCFNVLQWYPIADRVQILKLNTQSL